MPDKPTFFAQEFDYSCAVACLRMVLSGFGIMRIEQELRELCDCGLEGTHALKLVDAARKLGLKDTRKCNLTLDELIAERSSEKYPIVCLRTYLNNLPMPTQHAYVVLNANQDFVTVLDPLFGERELPTDAFEREWRQMRGLTILCQK
ncbi:MAG: cysteine peptidase family C39 domain-containing protein [bacterium]